MPGTFTERALDLARRAFGTGNRRAAVEPTGHEPLVIAGDCRVRAGTRVPDMLLVEGDLVIEAGVRFDGAAHVLGHALVEPGAVVTRVLHVEGNLEVRSDARLAAAIVQGDVTLREGAVVENGLECETLFLDTPSTARSVPVADADPPIA